MKFIKYLSVVFLLLTITACGGQGNQDTKDKQQVQNQQAQYAKFQPVPQYNYSLERDLLIQLYNIRNQKAVTHSVWRSDYGLVEGDCPSFGFSLPYDTSLTNPLARTGSGRALTTIEQAEPNGIFASKNTSATWVMCVGENGTIDPIYVESKVSVYPYPVNVDYTTTRVIKAGASSVNLTVNN